MAATLATTCTNGRTAFAVAAGAAVLSPNRVPEEHRGRNPNEGEVLQSKVPEGLQSHNLPYL